MQQVCWKQRVEQRVAAVLHELLHHDGQHADAGEHVPLVERPVVMQRGGGYAQNESDAAAGEHRAGGPHERLGLTERDGHLEQRSGEDRGEDLGDADMEPEPHLAERVQCEDHRRDVQSGIAYAWKNDWIIAAQDAH